MRVHHRQAGVTAAVGAVCVSLCVLVACAEDMAAPGPAVAPNPGVSPPTLTAKSAALLEGATGDRLFVKDADARRYPASLTKVLTALVALRNPADSELARVSEAAVQVEGARAGLEPGQWVTVSDLLAAALVRSGNDAAVVLAEHIGGSVDGFATMMNETAAALGATHSHFTNPHGLHDPNHYTTANDLGRIMYEAMRVPKIRDLVGERQALIASSGNGSGQTLMSRNRLLDRYEGANGIKTGYTAAAGRCLAASAQRGSRELIAIVLDAEKLFDDAETLLDWGFENFETVELAGPEKTWWRVPVQGGHVRELRATPARDVLVVVPKGGEAGAVTETAFAQVRAPVDPGDEVGQMRVTLPDGVVQQVPIVSTERIERSLWAAAFTRTGTGWPIVGVVVVLVGVSFYAAASESTRRRRRRLAAQMRRADGGGTGDRQR